MNTFAQANPDAKAPDLPDIHAKWIELKTKRIKQFPQNNLRASSAGHPCDRFHYHAIHDWREKELHDPILQSIFDEGKLHERDLMQTLSDLGFEVVEQQRSFQIEKPLITGSIDGIMRHEGNDYPFDAKSISPHDFDAVTAIEDLLYSKKIYQRNYPAQMQLYLLMTGNELGFLLFKNKVTGEPKQVWCQIDYDYCEKILKRAERVYLALKSETPPTRIEDLDACMKCNFRHVCLPDIQFGPGVIPIDDKELEDLLTRRFSLEGAAKGFKFLDETIKEAVTQGGVGEKICGDYLIRVTEHERTTKEPITWNEKITKYFRTQFLKLKKDGKDG